MSPKKPEIGIEKHYSRLIIPPKRRKYIESKDMQRKFLLYSPSKSDTNNTSHLDPLTPITTLTKIFCKANNIRVKNQPLQQTNPCKISSTYKRERKRKLDKLHFLMYKYHTSITVIFLVIIMSLYSFIYIIYLVTPKKRGKKTKFQISSNSENSKLTEKCK